jgi:deoxyadenosine/deoxycytidine kinase
MGKLIVIVGSTGVGKTALVRALSREGQFVVGLEEHDERPFQRAFKADSRYALANQLDYLLLRAGQERLLRQSPQTGLMDGGLEMDFHGFSRLFHARGWLSDTEFDLCSRFYDLVRTHQPAPERIIHLTARPDVIAKRLSNRKRINIAAAKDAAQLDAFLGEWLATLPADRVLQLDVSENDPSYMKLIPALLKRLS